MELVRQINAACVPTSIFMLNDNKDFKYIKRYCKKHLGYSSAGHRGSDLDVPAIKKLLEDLGHEVLSDIERERIATIHNVTRFNKGILIIYSAVESSGHCVAWDGYNVFDPDWHRVETATEFVDRIEVQWILPKIHPITIKTNLHHRIINATKLALTMPKMKNLPYRITNFGH